MVDDETASWTALTPASTSPPPTNTRSDSSSAARATLVSFFLTFDSFGQTTLRDPGALQSVDSAEPKLRSSPLAAPIYRATGLSRSVSRTASAR